MDSQAHRTIADNSASYNFPGHAQLATEQPTSGRKQGSRPAPTLPDRAAAA